MKLGNLIIGVPGIFLSTFLKTVKVNTTDEVNKQIVQKGLYHCTSKENVDKILKSGKIKASKNFSTTYGTPGAFMFLGIPDIENFIKNLSDLNRNPILNPTEITYAIKLNPELNELSNYKSRIMDEVIVHEGDCIIPQERTQKVELVKDIERDEQGNIVLDNYGRKKICLRERTKEEIERDGDVYIPSQEYLEALEDYKIINGYAKDNYLIKGNRLNTITHVSKIEGVFSVKNTINSLNKFFKNLFNNQKKIEENQNEKVHRVINEIEQGKTDTKKSVFDSKYSNYVADLSVQGINQLQFSDVFPEFLESREGNYLKQKITTIDSKPIKNSKIHGLGHSNRTATLALIIAQREGLNLNDRMLDILVTAGEYHDIGRITDVGPHAKRSVKLVDKMDLFHLNGEKYSNEDMSILKAVIDAHEGKEEKALKMPEKYKVAPSDLEDTMTLINLIKDADALDRARLSTKKKMNLNPNYLKLGASKSLIDFSFQFEALTRNIKDFSYILNYDKSKIMQENGREDILQERQNQNELSEERNKFLKDQQKGAPSLEEQRDVIENLNSNIDKDEFEKTDDDIIK